MKIQTALALALVIQGLASAQQGKLTVEDARNLALANSRSLAKYAITLQSSALDEQTQYHSLLPSISLGANAGVNLWNRDGNPDPSIAGSVSAGASLELKETLPLWDGKKFSIQRIINGLNTESARQDALAEYYTVLDAVDSAYYTVLKALANLEAAESSLETAALSLSIAEVRRQNGMINEAAYLEALARKENQENARGQSRRDLSLARLKLKNLLGLTELPELEGPDFGSLEGLIEALALLDEAAFERLRLRVWDSIEERNPALVKAGLNTARARQNLSLAQWSYSPTLSASFGAGVSYDFMEQSFTLNEGRLTLSAIIPLGLWATGAAVKRSSLALDQAGLDYQGARESLDVQLQTCLMNLIAQAGQIRSASRALDYAAKNFEHALELYRLSQNSLSSLNDAESLMRNNMNQLITARYGFLSALSTLRGLGVFESEAECTALLTRSIQGGLR